MARDNGGANLAWFFAGAALGAAVALLWAPQSGSETREVIRRRTQEGREKLSESGREVYEMGRELYERGKGVAEDAALRFEKGKEAAADLFERGRGYAKEAAGSFARRPGGSAGDSPSEG
jgi:gas vesicle protein